MKNQYLPETVAEFKKLIEEAKASKYMLDEDDKIFYRGVWQGTSGSNIAFISETTLQVRVISQYTFLNQQ